MIAEIDEGTETLDVLVVVVVDGVACSSFPAHTQQTFHGALRVIDYLMRKVSVNRANDMWMEIYAATRLLYSKSPMLQPLIESQTGIILPVETSESPSIVTKIVNWIKKFT